MSTYSVKDSDGAIKYFGSRGTGAIGDPLFTTETPFGLFIAEGLVVGHEQFDKYGKNDSIGTGTTPEDIWHGGGVYTGFPTGSAETLEIASSDANDTSAGTGARTVKITNLIDSTGAEAADVTVSLNGTTQVSLGAGTYTRCSRVIVLTAGSGGANAGTLTLRHTSTTANIFAVMPIGANQTFILAYTVPLGKTLYLHRINVQMSRLSGAAGTADVSFKARPFGTDGVFNTIISPTITDSSHYTFENNGYKIFTARTDIKFSVDSVSDNSTVVSGDLGGFIIAD